MPFFREKATVVEPCARVRAGARAGGVIIRWE